MKLSLLFALLFSLPVLAQDLSYYLPKDVKYDPAIPKPKDVIHHEVGEWHVTHDRLVNYMYAVAKANPSRIKLELMGYSYEQRPQVLLIITSPQNHQRLEEIRKQHVALTDPQQSANLNTSNMPAVAWIGHSIHGNEPSGANASLVSAYYLAAAQGQQIDDLLNNVVILFDPSFNPDGLQRFSTWTNQHKSKTLVTDPNSREFNEVWPGGRFNHYWFDINRDWLPAVHVESQNRLKWFHLWKPNVLTDHHEMGSNATFFFQPGVPARTNPLTPAENQTITAEIGKFHAKHLDRIGSLYFTKEQYDDYYYGKGSTYPDVNGAIGILFEQASSRGHAQQTTAGLLTFPFTIRNQFTTTLSTLEAVHSLRKRLLDYQRSFYQSSLENARKLPTKAYVFGDPADPKRSEDFITMLERHQIEVYALAKNITVGGKNFQSGAAYVVPTAQNQHQLIRGIFEKTTSFNDSIFYDITAWTLPLAFGLHYAELDAQQYNAALLDRSEPSVAPMELVKGGRATYAYMVDWKGVNAPGFLYELMNNNIQVRLATAPTEIATAQGQMKFTAGSLMIPVTIQSIPVERIHDLVANLASKYGVVVHALQTGAATSGSDLGSARFQSIAKPVIATIVGRGINPVDAGELWHLLDQRFNIPISHLEPVVFNSADINKYNTIVLTGGSYTELNRDKLRNWVQAGGLLICTEEAVTWAAQNGISNVTFKRPLPSIDSTKRAPYTDRESLEGYQALSGAILGASVDLTHPLAYGYTKPVVHLFKSNRVFMEKSKNPYATPFYYEKSPLVSGWISRENTEAIKNSAAVVVNTVGSGRVISIADNPNFRAFWLEGSKLMMNAIFFGRMIDAGSARTE